MLIAWLACYSPAVFADRYADAQCERLFTCDPATASLLYWSEEDCRPLSQSQIEANNDCISEHCAYDPVEAEACVAEAVLSRCEEFLFPEGEGPCDAVWRDCDGAEAACAE